MFVFGHIKRLAVLSITPIGRIINTRKQNKFNYIKKLPQGSFLLAVAIVIIFVLIVVLVVFILVITVLIVTILVIFILVIVLIILIFIVVVFH